MAGKTATDDQLTLVARLYHVDGLGQAEVARLANVSQAKVSRLLTQAKERGIVRISVAEYQPRNTELESQLQALLGLRDVVVIKCDPRADDAMLRQTVGYFGGPILKTFFQRHDTIAIAGGRTIREVVCRLPDTESLGLKVVQAMGHVDADTCDFDAHEIGRLMVHQVGGSFASLNAPAFMPDKQARDVVFGLEQVREVRQLLSKAQVAIVGIGSLSNSVFAERQILSKKMLSELQAAGAVGEICGRFFDASGHECETSWAERVVSVSLEEIRKISTVIAVSCGSDRCEALYAATLGGLIKGVLIDEVGARALVQSAKSNGRIQASTSSSTTC